MPRNTLLHPIREHTRMDGRRAHPVSRLDFQGEVSNDFARHDDRKYLEPGLLIGFVARYHYPQAERDAMGNLVGHNRSRRLYMIGEYDGESATINVPRHRWHPQDPRIEVEAPLFRFQVYANAFTKVEVGSIAVACLEEGTRAQVGGEDHVRIQEAIQLEKPGTYVKAHIGAVLIGSLFYATPPEHM